VTAPRDDTWKIDRHIPIAVIFALLVQTGTFIWWMSALSSRVDTATEANARQDDEIAATEAALASQQVITATAAAELRAVRDSLGEVKEALADQSQLLREILANGKGSP
jgi:Na+-transporting methylmalonyl-CoA/oxaloacetate decarboxylase gamma subunit